jgi:hypothetical protein
MDYHAEVQVLFISYSRLRDEFACQRKSAVKDVWNYCSDLDNTIAEAIPYRYGIFDARYGAV